MSSQKSSVGALTKTSLQAQKMRWKAKSDIEDAIRSKNNATCQLPIVQKNYSTLRFLEIEQVEKKEIQSIEN